MLGPAGVVVIIVATARDAEGIGQHLDDVILTARRRRLPLLGVVRLLKNARDFDDDVTTLSPALPMLLLAIIIVPPPHPLLLTLLLHTGEEESVERDSLITVIGRGRF